MLDIYVDADACPVKNEVYKVAARCQLQVFIVSNSPIKTPRNLGITIHSIGVGQGENIADDWIAENIGPDDICITADIPLADRCIKVGAHVLGPRGKPFTEESIGEALATRDLMSSLRESGQINGGPPGFNQKDRSQFLNYLDQIIQKVRNQLENQ